MSDSNVITKRINKYLGESGLCSRREADRWVEEGRVTINGRIAVMGDKVQAGDHIKANGKLIKIERPTVYLILNKPRGITCTTDIRDPSNIISYLRYSERIFPVGRLDKDSDGLIFLTNDGDIVNKILRAGNQHDKEYYVTVNKNISPEFLEKMAHGVPILDTVTKPCRIRQVSKNAFVIILQQGLNRQIRRMTEYCGYEVMTLTRTRIMNIKLDDLPVGRWRYFTPDEIKKMLSLVQDSSKTAFVAK